MSELTSFLTDISILVVLTCNAISIFALRSRIIELEQRMEEADRKTKPQMDCFFRNPTKEEMESVNRYIESISIPTGVNVFDLMDELQTERKDDE